MQIFEEREYPWNHGCAPYGNLGRVDPQKLADLCDANGIPWYTDGWPYASGIKIYCEDFNLFSKMIRQAKE